MRQLLRVAAGRKEQPAAAIFDSRTLQSSPESGARAGYDGAKRRKGSQTHLAVDPLGHLLALCVTAADEQDREQVAELAQQGQARTGQSVEVAFVDQGYTGDAPLEAAAEQGIRLEVIKLPQAKKGCVLLPRSFVVERDFAWMARFRRLARDYGRLPQTLAGLHFLAFAILRLASLYPSGRSLLLKCITASKKGQHELKMRTLFGTLTLDSPRFYTCPCQAQTQRSWSPLADLFPERTTPEFLALQVKWAALVSYGMTTRLLTDLLPLEHAVSTATLSRHVHQVAERLEGELGEEQYSFIEGCPQQWHALLEPEAPLTVSVDGGYVHARSEGRRQDGSFEVLVGKSVTGDRQTKRFGSVYGYDQKPRRRICEVLRAQGMQMNQAVTFLTDGGDTVRDLIDGLNPLAEHVLDWFHVTMRLTVLKQMAKGVPEESKGEQFEEELDRVKWYLWHGNVFKATRLLEDLRIEIDDEAGDAPKKLARALDEIQGYISSNRASIPNYGDRYHNGEPISSSLAESTVNHVISKRFVKKQQMRWTRRGAHLLLQIRTKVLDEELQTTFVRWYPGMIEEQRTA